MKPKKQRWLDRTLLRGPYITLVLSEKEFHAAMKHCQIHKADRGEWIRSPTADATLHSLTNPAGEQCCIVAVRVKPKTDPTSVVGILVHEAVHVWQQFKELIGEEHPSPEFEAYAIQTISQNLMCAYSAQAPGKKSKRE